MEQPTQLSTTQAIVTGLLETHWREIIEAQRKQADGSMSVSLTVKLGRNGKNVPTVRARIAFGPRIKDGVSAELPDPNQSTLKYTIKES